MRKVRSINNTRFGLEIEVEFPNKKDSQMLIDKHRVIRGWEIAYDGSLSNGAEYRPKKTNKLYWSDDSCDQLAEILGLIKAHKGKVSINCGVHVHIDMKRFTNKEIVKIVHNYIKKQSIIYKKFKPYRDRIEYAHKIPKNILKDLDEDILKHVKKNNYNLLSRDDYYADKHYSLNILALKAHNTLEFRIFNGTTDIKKIKKYIKFCLNFCIKNYV